MYYYYKHCKKNYVSAYSIASELKREQIIRVIDDISVKLDINNHNLELKENDYITWATERNHLHNDLDLFKRALLIKE